MQQELILRKATQEDMTSILEIIAAAQEDMRQMGSTQWQNGYPNQGVIEDDILKGRAFVMCLSNGRVVLYGAVVFDGEQAYQHIEGHWLTEGEYVVVHRLAVSHDVKRQGVATEFMRRIEGWATMQGMDGFRIDTHRKNHSMLQLLEKMGFMLCGRVAYGEEERLAFEKRLRFL